MKIEFGSMGMLSLSRIVAKSFCLLIMSVLLSNSQRLMGVILAWNTFTNGTSADCHWFPSALLRTKASVANWSNCAQIYLYDRTHETPRTYRIIDHGSGDPWR
jgi:hypothetical protein